jgi:hypothetical protein
VSAVDELNLNGLPFQQGCSNDIEREATGLIALQNARRLANNLPRAKAGCGKKSRIAINDSGAWLTYGFGLRNQDCVLGVDDD